MAFLKLAPFDAKTFANKLKALTPGTVFDQFVAWKLSVDRLRDAAAATHAGVFGPDGIKEDLDRHTVRLNNLDARLDVLEAASTSAPFPGSG